MLLRTRAAPPEPAAAAPWPGRRRRRGRRRPAVPHAAAVRLPPRRAYGRFPLRLLVLGALSALAAPDALAAWTRAALSGLRRALADS